MKAPALILLCLIGSTLSAQTFHGFEVVHVFRPPSGEPHGQIVVDSDGALWGVATADGKFRRGSAWALHPDGPGFDFEEIHSFAGPDGMTPYGGLTIGPGGDFYGTTITGGVNEHGTVFRTDHMGRVTTLHDFAGQPDGSYAQGALLYASDGFLYGTASVGGASNSGMVFRVESDGQLTHIHDFDGSDGNYPNPTLVEMPDGYFYGTTLDGPAGQSTVFRVNAAGDFAVLHVLTEEEEGSFVQAGLAAGPDGLLYGTSVIGGAHDSGTVFRLDTSGNFEKIYDFGSNADDGASSFSPLFLASDGQLYGTTYGGGTFNDGTAYRIDTAGGLTTLHSFSYLVDGARPSAPFVERNGVLFSTTTMGGDSGAAGIVFEMAFDGSVTTVHGFGSKDGFQPAGGLRAASDGNLYGMTQRGGAHGVGTLYRLDPADTLTSLHDFADAEGTQPETALFEGPDGTLLGVAPSGGGGASAGTLFQTDFTGDLTLLHDFEGTDGSDPYASPLRAADGDIYGTAFTGGSTNYGTVYHLGATFETLHDFAGGDTAFPTQLVEGDDGNLYGLTVGGGNNIQYSGSAFRIDLPSGNFTTIHVFGTKPDDPVAPTWLILGSDGFLYGTSYTGGIFGWGTVFQMDGSGAVSVLHSFDGNPDMFGPSSLMEASDGSFYGTRPNGGVGLGSIFRMTPDRVVTDVHVFENGDGIEPTMPPVEANGALYGTTPDGVLYRLLPAPAAPVISAIVPTSGTASGATAFRIVGNHMRLGKVSVGGVESLSIAEFDIHTVVARSPQRTPGGLSDVTVMNLNGSRATLPDAWFADFLDVPSAHPFHDFVESIVRAGITAGCGGGNYCVASPVTRAQMAVLLLKAEHGPAYAPPACSGIFPDTPCPGPFTDWIEQLAAEGITSGCGGGNYCPASPVTRAQMAVFLLKTLLGSSYAPPVATGIFGDVPVGSFAADWIEDLYGRQITGGCSSAPLLYCPNNPNTRGQMAVFVVKSFNLQ